MVDEDYFEKVDKKKLFLVLFLSVVFGVLVFVFLFPSSFQNFLSSLFDRDSESSLVLSNVDSNVYGSVDDNAGLLECPYECCVGDSNFVEKPCSFPEEVCELHDCVLDDSFGLKNLGAPPKEVLDELRVVKGFKRPVGQDFVEDSSGLDSGSGSGSYGFDSNSDSNTSVPLGVYDCPFDCCEGEFFVEKLCPVNKVCVNNECVDQEDI